MEGTVLYNSTSGSKSWTLSQSIQNFKIIYIGRILTSAVYSSGTVNTWSIFSIPVVQIIINDYYTADTSTNTGSSLSARYKFTSNTVLDTASNSSKGWVIGFN